MANNNEPSGTSEKVRMAAGLSLLGGLGLIVLAPLLIALGIVVLQCWWYFSNGAWTPLSVMDGLSKIMDTNWFMMPNGWPTVTAIVKVALETVPLSLLFLAIGLLVMKVVDR
jgi:hypothetical protein